MSDKETLRQTALQQSQAYETKNRFGLFSQPISTAIGDDGPYKTKLHPKNQNGKPLTQPRNIQTGPCKSGQLASSFFGDINSLATSDIKDQYIDPDRKLILYENQQFAKGPQNENKYLPASKTGYNTLCKSSYPYVEENPPAPDPKRNRQPDGRVKSKLRNAYTNPGSKVVTNYFKHEKHIDDPYDRAHQQEVQRMRKSKALERQNKFKPSSRYLDTFNKASQVYGQDVELKHKIPKEPKYTKNRYSHQSKWRSSSPGRSGYSGCFSPFPAYIEDPPKEPKRKTSQSKKEPFRTMNRTLSTPCSSITKKTISMHKYHNRSFSFKKF